MSDIDTADERARALVEEDANVLYRTVLRLTGEVDRLRADLTRLRDRFARAQADLMRAEAERDGSEARVAKFETTVQHLRGLLSALIEDEPCRYDHNDFCQAHYYDRPCAMGLAKEACGRD